MSAVAPSSAQPLRRKECPREELLSIVKSELDTVVTAWRNGSKVYESVRNLDQVIGTQYGNRVLYELIQNAHDAHPSGTVGRICLRLILESADRACLYVANGGYG